MGLDIRLPIGLMFVLLGLSLAGYGFFGDASIYKRSLGININLWWGLVLFLTGSILVLLGRSNASRR